jgi:hypothetical protein
VLCVEERLVPLVCRSIPGCTVIAEGEADSKALEVSHIFPLCSLGVHVDLRPVTVQGWPGPYLLAAEERVGQMRRDLATYAPG